MSSSVAFFVTILTLVSLKYSIAELLTVFLSNAPRAKEKKVLSGISRLLHNRNDISGTDKLRNPSINGNEIIIF